MKKLNFFKTKLGSTAIEAMVIVPLWLLTIVFVARTLIISNSRYKLADEALCVGNLIAISKSKEDALNNIDFYFKNNNIKNINVNDIEMSVCNGVNSWKNDWDSGDNGKTVRVKMTIDTPFEDLRFKSMTIGGKEIEFFPARFTNEFTVVLNFS